MTLLSTDGGRSLGVTGWELPTQGYTSEGSGLEETPLSSVAFDSRKNGVVFGSSPRGLHRSTDGGINWELCNEGLRIPLVYRVFAPVQTPNLILASTPAGLQTSEDGGTTWEQPILVLNGPGVDRAERGGLGYLCGYWPGRYFDFITDEQVSASPESWKQ
jgi:hypothetical protein